MSEKESIKWPYGYTGKPFRNQDPINRAWRDPWIRDRNPVAENFVAALQSMAESERREFLTWLREMIDHYGYDSVTAIERGIEQE